MSRLLTRGWLLLAVALAMLLVSACTAGLNLPDDPGAAATPSGSPGAAAEQGCVWTAPKATPTASPVAIDGTIHQIGQPAKLGDLVVTVNKVFCIDGYNATQPQAGSQFIVVDVTVTNNGSDTFNIAANYQTRLQDKYGQQTRSDSQVAMFAGNELAGTLTPGGQISGRAAFDVPIDSEGLVFAFDTHPFSNLGTVYFSIRT
ncbi:MAG TPA: DUF4352 domain-containing protein [Thermomicrobiaceae bacterium]|nr:DUF4352 domain-containing protein [Thermomicrobiaceae bacterium]